MTRFLAGCAVFAASVVVGCGGNDDASSSVGTDATVAEAPSDGTRDLNIPDQAPGEAPKLTTEPASGEFQGIDFAAYDASIDDLLFLLDEYWASTLPDTFGTKYSSPADAFAYYPDENPVGCGGQPAVPGNAEYCPADGIISWDEPGLMVPFYSEVGDMAVGFVLAHEWGHLIQQELGLDFPVTIEAELNADCFAGDFAGGLADEGLLVGGTSLKPGTDLVEAADAIFTVGDDPSVPWYDPQAHGTAEERIDAFTIGFDEGAQACVDSLGPGFTEIG